jgi:peroxiredoxin
VVLLGSEYTKMQHGDFAPEFSLPATDGKTYALHDFVNKPLLIIFMCNHCPYVLPKIVAINKIGADYPQLVVIGVNPNDSVNYPKDSFEKMKEYMERWGASFVYLWDETQEAAKAYGAVCTPDPFLFDKVHKLVFRGRFNAAHGKPGGEELHKAIGEFLERGRITVAEQPSMGCSIKWKQ